MWALQRLRKLLTTEFGQSININRILGDNEGETRALVRRQWLSRLHIFHIKIKVSAMMYIVFSVHGKIENGQMNSVLAQVCKSVKVAQFIKEKTANSRT